MRISTGNFGSVVAQPQRAAQINPQAYGTDVAGAVERVGAVAGGIADHQVSLAEQEHRQAQRDLEQARSLRLLSETKMGLRDLQDEIARGVEAGEIAAGDADNLWQQRSAKFAEQQLANADPRNRDLFQAQVGEISAGLRAGVRDTVTRRMQQDVGGELVGLRESLLREAQGGDRAAVNGRYSQVLEVMGPKAGMNPVQIATDLQKFRESTAETEAYRLVNGAKNSMQALAQAERALNGEAFADLDPQRRAVLNNTIAGARVTLEQRAEIAARRAEIAAERRDRKAQQAFDAAYKLATDGKVIAPEFVEQVSRAVAGTVYAAALPQVLNQAKEGTSFAMQPLAVQRAILDKMAAKGNTEGWTPTEQERYARLDAANKSAAREYEDDPLRAAVERGVLSELAPVSMGGIEQVAASIAARQRQADQVAVVVGAPVSPLTKDEARQFGEMLSALPVSQRANAIATVSAAVGAVTAGALAKQMDQSNRPLALAMGFGKEQTAPGRYTSELILKGAQAIRDKVVRVDNSAEVGWRSEIARSVRGAFGSAEMENAVIDAAFYIRAGLEADGDGSNSKAVELAAGRIVERNGAKIPLPQGWGERRFRDVIRTYPEASIRAQTIDGQVYSGSVAIPLEKFMQKLPTSPLRDYGPGRYVIPSGTTVLTNREGQPIVIDVLNRTDGGVNAR